MRSTDAQRELRKQADFILRDLRSGDPDRARRAAAKLTSLPFLPEPTTEAVLSAADQIQRKHVLDWLAREEGSADWREHVVADGEHAETWRRRLRKALAGPLYIGWDPDVETPEQSGLYLLTSMANCAPDVNAVGVFGDGEQAVTFHASVRYKRPASYGEVESIVREIGLTQAEVVAAGYAADSLENRLADLDGDLARVDPEFLARVPRLRQALETAGYDAIIAWHVVTNYEAPFVLVWNASQVEIGEPVPTESEDEDVPELAAQEPSSQAAPPRITPEFVEQAIASGKTLRLTATNGREVVVWSDRGLDLNTGLKRFVVSYEGPGEPRWMLDTDSAYTAAELVNAVAATMKNAVPRRPDVSRVRDGCGFLTANQMRGDLVFGPGANRAEFTIGRATIEDGTIWAIPGPEELADLEARLARMPQTLAELDADVARVLKRRMGP